MGPHEGIEFLDQIVDTHAISDITGQTGLAIVNAILEGEWNPVALAKLRNERIQASEEVIAKSLVGDYRPEHLFTLQQSLTAYRSYLRLIEDCDREIRRALQQFHPPDPPQASGPTPPPTPLQRRRGLRRDPATGCCVRS